MKRRKKGNDSIVTSLDQAVIDANFLPLYAQVVSSTVDAFVENRRAVIVVHEVGLVLVLVQFSFIEGVDFVIHDGQWMVCGIPISLNKWSPSMRLLKEELSHVPVWVKFHDVPLVAYTLDELSLMATKIGTPMMLDSYTNSMCLESWREHLCKSYD
ncbi:zinc knuckle CX2CX4HX4C containing protein [Tanacetum coccineum]